MSVINQMLKDLEERTPTHGQTQIQPMAPKKTSTVKIIILTAIIILGLNALGFYIWNLQERVAPSESKEQAAIYQPNQLLTAIDQNHQEIEQPSLKKEQSKPAQVSVEPEIAQQTKPEQQLQKQAQAQAQEQAQTEEIIARNTADKDPVQSFDAEHDNSLELDVNSLELEKNQLSQLSQLSQLKQPQKSTRQSPSKLVISDATPIASVSTEPKTPSGTMSVSRRQLTSSELVVQTLSRAEKAITNNDMVKAEQLFEEILIIDPNHKQARKKLAALWFGRQSYQQAVNLLSQGIALDRLDSEMRLMKAQIQLKQGQTESAYNTLKPLAAIEQEDYQAMLANIAQQVEQYPSAIMAYQVLIKMQPYSGRWYLGLAIVYDKNSQFSLAVDAYEHALTKTDLSASSVKFAEQRMQALGE